MAKKIPVTIADLMLDQAEGTQIDICTGEPANFGAIAGLSLASAVITGGYTKANGDVSGRKDTLAAQTGISITADGTDNHVAISDGSSILKLVTTCASQALTSGGTVDTSAFALEIPDPS